MHLDGTHLLGDILARALYQPLAQVGGELCPCVGGYIDAAAQRSAHVGGNLPNGIHFHRVRNEDTGLPVRVIHLQLYRDNRTSIFQRRDFNIKPFALNLCRAYHHRITGDDFVRYRHRLQQTELDSLPVRHTLRPINARRYGVFVRYGRDAHRRIETAVTLLREGGDKLGVAHRL